jgi:hypothetical protein
MDEITDAILTNPELLARAQGRDIKITDNYTNAKGQQMVTLLCGNDFWCISLDKLTLNDSQRR